MYISQTHLNGVKSIDGWLVGGLIVDHCIYDRQQMADPHPANDG